MPDESDVFLDGKKVGATPLFLQQVLVGEHDLKIAKAGYQMLSDRINIQEKEIYTIDNKTLVQELADANSDSKNDDLAKSQPYNIIEKNVGHQTEQVTTRPSNTIPNRNASEKIFDVVEQMPSFSGGFVAMNEFLNVICNIRLQLLQLVSKVVS